MASLENATEWIKTLGLPRMATSCDVVLSMTACAFIAIELPREQLSEIGRRLIDTYKDGCPEILLHSVKEPSIALTDKLVEQSMNSHEDSEVESLEFEILNVFGPGVTKPGMYAEIVHDDDIASSIERWSKDVDGLPGSVIGHVSIEIYRDTLLPDALSAVESKNHGEPEPLEALISSEVCKIIKRFVTA